MLKCGGCFYAIINTVNRDCEDRMNYKFYHIDKMPDCYICKEQMDYWVPGLASDKHCHASCLGKKLADEAIEHLKQALDVVCLT